MAAANKKWIAELFEQLSPGDVNDLIRALGNLKGFIKSAQKQSI